MRVISVIFVTLTFFTFEIFFTFGIFFFQEPQPLPTTPFPSQLALASDDIASVYEKLALEIEPFLQATSASGGAGAQASLATMNANLHVLHDCLLHARRNSRDFVSALTLLQKVSRF